MKKNKKMIINGAMSLHNGFVIFFNFNELVGIQAYYDNCGSILTQVLTGSEIAKVVSVENFEILNNSKKQMCNILLYFYSVLLTTLTKNYGFMLACVSFILSDGVAYCINFFNLVMKYKSKKGSKYELARYHAAEHKVINAYERLGRVPTYKEIVKSSSFSARCSSLNYINTLFFKISLPLFIMISYSILLKVNYYYINVISSNNIMLQFIILFTFATILLLAYSHILYIIKKYALLRFMEILFFNKPTANEIRLSIVAINEYDRLDALLNIKNFKYQ